MTHISPTVSKINPYTRLGDEKAVWVEGHRIEISKYDFCQWKVWVNKAGQDIWVIFEFDHGDMQEFSTSELGCLIRRDAVRRFYEIKRRWETLYKRKVKFSMIGIPVHFSGLTTRPKTIPLKSDWVIVAHVKSRTYPKVIYEVSQNKVTGKWVCTCPGHTHGRCKYVEYCYHITKIRR